MSIAILRAVIIAGGFAIALTGCYESADVTLTQSSHTKDKTYQGKTDPLLAKLTEKKLQDNLRARFDGQRDR